MNHTAYLPTQHFMFQPGSHSDRRDLLVMSTNTEIKETLRESYDYIFPVIIKLF